MTIIGIGHEARMGKDTVAIRLAKECGFKVFRWADALYEECRNCSIIGTLEGDEVGLTIRSNGVSYTDFTPDFVRTVVDWMFSVWPGSGNDVIKSRPFGEHPMRMLLMFDGMQAKNGDLLQWWGTDFRRAQDEQYWVKKLVGAIGASASDRIAIPDTRFPNEAQWVVDQGGEVWKVWADEPHEDTGRSATHASETALKDWKFDRVFENNGTIPELYAKAEAAMADMGLPRVEKTITTMPLRVTA